jgi:hypothetical protein
MLPLIDTIMLWGSYDLLLALGFAYALAPVQVEFPTCSAAP